MEQVNDITENSTISELTHSTIDTNYDSILSVDSTTTGTESDTSKSHSSDSMETSDDDSDDTIELKDLTIDQRHQLYCIYGDKPYAKIKKSFFQDSSESESETILTESTNSLESKDNDSSSDYTPSTTSSQMDISEEEEEEPEPKKRKRNPLDNFCLYTIKPINPDDTNLYIGSTVNFNRRKLQHKKAVTNKRGGTYYSILYRYIRRCGGWDNFIMEKILDFPCETKHEGLLKEKEYIIKHGASLNSVMPVSDFTERMNDI